MPLQVPTLPRVDATTDEDAIRIDELVGVLRRHRKLTTTIVSVVVGVAVLLYLITPRKYRSTTLLQIERTDISTIAVEDLFRIEGANLEYYETQSRLLSSRGLAENVVRNVRLADDPVFDPPRASWFGGTKRQSGAIEDATALGKLADRLLENLTVKPIKKTHMVEVAYLARTPELAARVVNGVADAYIEWGTSRRSSTMSRASSFLTKQVEALKQEIADKEAQLQAYGRSSDIVALDPESNVTLQRLQALTHDYTAAVSERILKEARNREYATAADDAIALNFAPAVITQIQTDVARLERDYANKLTLFKPDWPAMRELQAQIEKGKLDLQSTIAETAAKARDAARTEYLTAVRREQSLESEMERRKDAAMGLNEAAVQYNNLKVEVSTRRALLDSLLRKQSETDVASRLEGGRDAEVIVVDRGLVPDEAYRPSLRLNLAVGLLLGLMLGIGGAFLIEYLDRTIKTPEEVERILGVPVLGITPDASRRRGYGYGYGYGYGSRRKRKIATEKAREEPAVRVELVPHTKPKLAISESYRSFRTALMLSTADGLRSVLITSAHGGEGKTTSVANLAVVLSQLGKDVLLVDGDLRKPRQHQVFGVSNRVGLVDVLTRHVPFESAISATHVPKLTLLPSGPIPPNPAELLSSDRMKECLRQALERFEMVLFDSAPVLPVTDAVLLGGMVDGVVHCLRAGVVQREDAIACRDRLRQAQVHILGALLNGYRAGRRYGQSGMAADYAEEYGASPANAAGSAA